MQKFKNLLLNLGIVTQLKNIEQLPSKRHTHKTVYEHTVEAMSQASLWYPEDKIMLICAAFHDVGKTNTLTIKNDYRMFPNHHTCSCELCDTILQGFVLGEYITKREYSECMCIIYNHMRAKNLLWNKLQTLGFVQRFESLNILNKAIQFADIDIRSRNPLIIPEGEFTEEVQALKDAIKQYT